MSVRWLFCGVCGAQHGAPFARRLGRESSFSFGAITKAVAFKRSVQDTGASHRLHNSGKTPAIIYGTGAESKLIELDHNALYHALKKEAFHSSVLDIEMADKVEKALLHDFQLHPFKQLVLHVDFQRVSAKGKIHVKVLLRFLSQETAPGVKLSHGIVNRILNNVEMSCPPVDLPEFIEVDLGTPETGQTLHIADLKLSKDVTILTHGGDENPAVVNTSVPAGEKSAIAEEDIAAAGEDKPAAQVVAPRTLV